MSSVSLTVKGRGSKPAIAANLPATASTQELYKLVAAKTKLSVHRIRITSAEKKQTVDNDPKKTLADYGLKAGDSLAWKDLGPQIYVQYLTEYIGPLFIHPIIFFKGHELAYRFLPKPYDTAYPVVHSKVQTLAFIMVMIHYVKRELETVFVHRFSRATMPWHKILKNSAYYWGLSGVALALPLYGPWYDAFHIKRGSLRGTDEFLYPMLGVWIFAQVSNFICHLILRSLRPATDLKQRQIPSGYAFNKISSPNYTFESIGWLVFTLMTMDPFAALFWLVGTVQMLVWAKQKQSKYKKEFGSKYPKRWVMFPGLV